MARAGNIELGGSTASASTYRGAAALRIAPKPRVDFSFCEPDTNWEVEVRAANPWIVARSRTVKYRSEIEKEAPEEILKCLDCLAFLRQDCLALRSGLKDSVLLWNDNTKMILRQECLLTFRARMDDGANRQTSHWHPAFRAFRLSQISADIFDAYRHLFLGVEQLLHEVYPKGQQSESDWFRMALKVSLARVDLSRFEASSADPSAEIAKRHWDMRNRLFHGKTKGCAIAATPESAEIGKLYDELVELFRKIVNGAGFSGAGDGWVNPRIDEEVDGKLYGTGIDMFFTDDDSGTESFLEISPKRREICRFQACRWDWKGEFSEITGSFQPDGTNGLPSVRRICLVKEDKILVMHTVDHALEAVNIDGIDRFDFVFRLYRPIVSNPKTDFEWSR